MGETPFPPAENPSALTFRLSRFPSKLQRLGRRCWVRAMHDGVATAASAGKRVADWSIGLDFGTAFSKAAGTKIMSSESATLREVRPLRIGATAGGIRPYLVPSSLYLDRQRVHFGPHAIKKLVAADIEDRELVRSFKRALGAKDFENALDRYPAPAVD